MNNGTDSLLNPHAAFQTLPRTFDVPNSTSYSKYSSMQSYEVQYGGETHVIDDHRLATPDFSGTSVYTSFFSHTGDLSLMQWHSLIGSMIGFYKTVIEDLEAQKDSAYSRLYLAFKSNTMGEILPNEKRNNTENKKSPSDKMIEIISKNRSESDPVIVDYLQKVDSYKQAKQLLNRLHHSMSVIDMTFRAIQSFGATERKYITNGSM